MAPTDQEGLRQRLDDAVKRRDSAARNIERVQGRLDGARKTVEEVEAEIRARGIEPDKLDEAIEAVKKKAEGLVTELEGRITQSEQEISPFLGQNKHPAASGGDGDGLL